MFYHPDSHAKHLKLENIKLISYPTWNWLYHMKAKQKGKKRKRKQTDNIANIQISKIYKKKNITKQTNEQNRKTVININPPT